MIKLRYDHLYGSKLCYYPDNRYYYDDTMGMFWPLRPYYFIRHYWPLHMRNLWPTEHHMRKIRTSLWQRSKNTSLYSTEFSHNHQNFSVLCGGHYSTKRKMLKLRYDPSYGSRYQYLPVPPSKFYWDYNTYDPLGIYEPTRYRLWYPHYWPSHLLEYIPSSYSLRRLRLRNHLYNL
ncbi:hypothetical protein JTB14_017372 [Gonioctena quinquepunctata]|nr:hypothetical protein JTB14_017372 [Gonioctena quinquepunctata]